MSPKTKCAAHAAQLSDNKPFDRLKPPPFLRRRSYFTVIFSAPGRRSPRSALFLPEYSRAIGGRILYLLFPQKAQYALLKIGRGIVHGVTVAVIHIQIKAPPALKTLRRL